MKRWSIAAIVGLCFFGCWNDLANAQSKLNFDEKIAALDAWTIGYNSASSSCLTTATYGDETTVWIGLDDDEVYLALTNPNWQSIQEGKQYRIRIASLAGTRWQGNFDGISRGQEKGVISGGLKENFVKELIRTPGIAVYLGSTLIAKLNLDGSPAAFGAMWTVIRVETLARRKRQVGALARSSAAAPALLFPSKATSLPTTMSLNPVAT